MISANRLQSVRCWLGMTGLLALLSCCWPITPVGDGAGVSYAAIDEARPVRRVVLLSCDTLSAAHLPLYGYDKRTTTTLDSLAAWGVLFQRCIVPQGWTLSSHISMLTGLSPGVHRVGKHTALPKTVPLLTEMLADQDCVAGAFLETNQWLAADYGFGRGFQTYQFHNLEDKVHRWGFGWLQQQLAATNTPAVQWQFFLFLHFMSPHSRPVDPLYPMPYWAPVPIYNHYLGVPEIPPDQQLTADGKQWDMAAYDTADLRKGYDASVRYWDQERLRPVLGFLRRKSLLLDTLLIITSDHGEEIAEHGGYFHDSPHTEVREVPLLMIMPGRLPVGRVVTQPVSIMDITPTVLDLAGLPPPEYCQGVSLRPVLEGNHAEPPPRDFLVDGHRRGYALHPAAFIAKQDGTWWSLVASIDTTGAVQTFQPARVDSLLGLYDLTADPAETENLLASRPALARQLQERLTAALTAEAALAARIHADQVGDEVEISEDAKRKLRALGY
jgi:arylsulfatase A-like enzyme